MTMTWHTKTLPEDGDVVIVIRNDAVREQCMYDEHGKQFFVWRYVYTDNVFATDKTVKAWRKCSGFDF